MALSPVRSDLGPAPLQRTVTTAGAQIVFCDATNTPIAANPQGVNHPPSEVWVLNLAAGGTLVWLDLNGTSNSFATPAVTAGNTPFFFRIPGTIKSIEAATTSGYIIIAAFHPEP